jgi:hypothetical protein
VDTLQYRVIVHVLLVHDFTPLDDSDDEGPPSQLYSNSSDSRGDELLGAAMSSLHPWPRVFRLCGDVDEEGNHLLSLPQLGGDAS